MDMQHVEAIAQNPAAQITVSAGTIGAANADKIITVMQTQHWYDPFWLPVWQFLPWTQIGTVLGVPLLCYSLFVTIKNAIKKEH